MSVATNLHSQAKLVSETREILGPGENRMRVSEQGKRKEDALKDKKKHQQQKPFGSGNVTAKKLAPQSPKVVFKKDASSDSSSDSFSFNGSTPKSLSSQRKVRNANDKAAKIVPDVIQTLVPSPMVQGPVKRCDWITTNSDPMYVKFHDEEWGVPVYDERMLFELLVLSQALAEMTWPTILKKRDTFRIMFDNFDPSSVARFDDKKFQSMRVKSNLLLSEPKLLAVVENAKQVLKIKQEFGSFSNYCWRFVNHLPVRNGFKYARQVPAKTPKSELISKDLMRRGFQCVGPMIVYSFMQVSGMTNDHLVSCSRYTECNTNLQVKIENQDLSA